MRLADAPTLKTPRRPMSPEVPDDVFVSGTTLAERYRIVGVLGRGGMGVVYRADDLKLEQGVALKFLPESMKADPEKLLSLLHEVKIAREISHPNVCSVYDVGEEGGRHFLSMKYIDGQDLSSLLGQVGRLPKEKGVEIARRICYGLAAAHKKGVLHRDLKPANLLIDRTGNPFITDFGLASLSENLQDDPTIVGTPAYMAPEQHQGLEVSVQTDVYALGLVLYEMFTGRRPFRAANPLELARLHCQSDPPPPSAVVGDMAPDLERVILRCLRKDPGERPSSALEVAAAMPGARAVSDWRPAAGHELPRRPNWILEAKIGQGGVGEAWSAVHEKTRERRVFKFCYDDANRRALEREITLYLLLKDKLGEREDFCRILDWSFHEEPYFIESEYTPGGNLLEWSERQGGLREVTMVTRLDIAAQIGEALAAAHSVAVLHQDVKPANVLVAADAEGRPRIKLSDFGAGAVSRPAGSGDDAEATVILDAAPLDAGSSHSGSRLYMAPELLEDKAATLETDVYALGVVLYQLVVGDFARSLVHSWQDDVDDELLRGDIAEAVDRSPQKRLKAQQLAERLRHLEDRRWVFEKRRSERKQAERNRLALERAQRRRKLVSIAVGALVVFAVAISAQAWRLSEARHVARREAERAEREAARANQEAARANQAAEAAQRTAAEAQQLSEFLVEVFDAADPREILDRGADSVGALRERPELQVELMDDMVRVYRKLGRYDAAVPLVEQTLEKKRQLFGEEHAEVAESLYELGRLWRLQGDPGRAGAFFRQAIDLQGRLEGSDPKVAANLHYELAEALAATGDFAAAEPNAGKAVEGLRDVLPSNDPRLGEAKSLWGACLTRIRRFDDAEPMLREGYSHLRIALGAPAPPTRLALQRLIDLYEAWDRPAMAIRYRAEARRSR